MKNTPALRHRPIGPVIGVGLLVLHTAFAVAQPSFITDGKASFAVAEIEYAMGINPDQDVACPKGLTTGYLTAEDSDADRDLFRQRITAANGQNLCLHPEAGAPDPRFRTVEATRIPMPGIDIDGYASSTSGSTAPATCAHDDFPGVNGELGIDNQFYRIFGCSGQWQPTGASNEFGKLSMLVGEWTILLTMSGVDDILNDPDVEVGIHAGADPLQLSPTREPLPYATYALDQDPRFRAKTRGRIVNGLLTTDPTDVRFHMVINSMMLERPLRDARLHATLTENGVVEGYLAGYTPIEAQYDLSYGFRNGKDASGAPASHRLKQGSASGKARTQDYTCEGAYYALYKHADGHPDESGQCTSISTQYRIRAIPAFVVDTETKSVNEELIGQ